MLQNAPNCTIPKKILGEACPRIPLANAWLHHASQVASRHATRPAQKKLPPPWQILHTPMDYYYEIYLRRCARRIHSGRQLIVCSTLYVYRPISRVVIGQKVDYRS